MAEDKKEMEPKLSEETIDYIKNLGKQTKEVTQEHVQEFITHAIKDQKTFASFIAYIDACQRKSPIFIRATAVHSKAILPNKMFDKNYKIYFEEISVAVTIEGSYISMYLNWSNNHQEDIRKILGEGSYDI